MIRVWVVDGDKPSTYPAAKRFALDETGALLVVAGAEEEPIAIFACGEWARAEVVSDAN